MPYPLLARLRRVVLLPLAALVLVATPPAVGQSTWCTFPEPMSSAEFGAILDRVGIEGPARDGATRAFEEYLAASLAIARDEIAPFCTETTGKDAADERELERRIETRQRLAARLAAVDATLADAIATAAGPAGETKARLERERLERRHWMRLVGGPSARGSAEFTDWLAERKITPDEAMLALIAARSSESTAQWRKLARFASDMPLAIRRLSRERGLSRPESGEQGDWERFFTESAKVRAEAAAPQRETRLAIRRILRETERSLAALLSPTDAASLRDWFLERTYPTLLRPRNPVPPLLKEATEKASAGAISKEALAEMQTIAATHTARRAELDGKIMDELDASWGEPRSGGFLLFSEAARESTRADELLAERGGLDAETVARIKGSTPALAAPVEAGAERLAPRVMVGGMEIELDEAAVAGGGTFVIQAGDEGGVGGVAMIAMSSDGMNGGQAKPISREDLAAWSRRLGIPDDSMPLLEVLLEDYRDRYAEIENGPLAELGNSPGPFGNPDLPAARRHDLRRDATERLIALDADFFVNLSAALTGIADAESLVRLAHERERTVRRSAMRESMGPSFGPIFQSEPFDLATVVAESDLPAEALAAMTPRLVAYDAELTPLLASSHSRYAAAARTAEIEQESAMRVMERDAVDGTVRTVTAGEPDAAALERQQAAQREMSAVQKGLRDATEAAVAAAIAALPDDASRARLRDAVDRAAFPRLFRDGRSAGPRFDTALELPDLDAARRDAITAARDTWQADWRRVTNEMLKSTAELAGKLAEMEGGGDAMPALLANQEAMQRLRFERSEANEKGMRALKALLTPEQAAKVGDLPPAPKRGPMLFGN